MKATRSLGIVIVTCIALGCVTRSEEHLSIGMPVSLEDEKNLQLFPVHANKVFLTHHKGVGPFLTLKTALSQNKVKVTEKGVTTDEIEMDSLAQADVNSLFVENTSSDSIIILNGEVVTGGNQDRMIASDVVLPPHSGQLDLSVFCVERGRWLGDDVKFEMAEQSLAPSNLRPGLSKTTDQQDVWQKVEISLATYMVESKTNALTDLKMNEGYAKKLQVCIDKFNMAFENEKDVVGIVAVSGGEIIGCDLFATPDLFAKQYHNLVQSYASGAHEGNPKRILTKNEVDVFLQDFLQDGSRAAGFMGNQKYNSTSSNRLHVSAF